jgi:hypothetical protein
MWFRWTKRSSIVRIGCYIIMIGYASCFGTRWYCIYMVDFNLHLGRVGIGSRCVTFIFLCTFKPPWHPAWWDILSYFGCDSLCKRWLEHSKSNKIKFKNNHICNIIPIKYKVFTFQTLKLKNKIQSILQLSSLLNQYHQIP